ncbi:AAA family ATPase [Mycolicibacterium litorale]|uniref:AAA family ATPase n=1 Tax=Mycolicibacterium litorale TaxID=758802 RepID=UPI003CE979EE
MTAANRPPVNNRAQPNGQDMENAHRAVTAIAAAFATKVVGQEDLRETLLIGLLTGGHILLEGVPGLAKTTAARVMADAVSARFNRIQCTPDLLPSDILGTQIYDSDSNSFVVQLGPVHANIVLLDEINRSSAKTQSAMLEAMEERQTTIAGESHPIPQPFLVIATQNPVDQEGTYPLSEAQTDRFMLKDVLRYPTPREEAEVIFRLDAGLFDRSEPERPVLSLETMKILQRLTHNVHLDPVLVHYISEVVHATRKPSQYLPQHLARLIEYGASPRATIAFSRATRAAALLAGRNHVLPDDIRNLAHRVLRHRLILGFEAVSAGVSTDDIVDAVMQSVRVP